MCFGQLFLPMKKNNKAKKPSMKAPHNTLHCSDFNLTASVKKKEANFGHQKCLG